MKKSLLNISLMIALSGTAATSTLWSAQAASSEAAAAESMTVIYDNSKPEPSEDYRYLGLGAGAATGALVAGPVGLVIGGLIGTFAGSSLNVTEADDPEYLSEQHVNTDQDINIASVRDSADSNVEMDSINVAQIGAISDFPQDSFDAQKEAIVDILTSRLSLDVYFRSGSISIESFYPARLAAIADLMATMPQLELHLDGYADRRGDETMNITLASQRIETVRQQLISAGVDENRILSKAFGEMKMVSKAGDLEAYTFDRKVVIRFERSTADSISTMTSTLSALPAKDTATETAALETEPQSDVQDSTASLLTDSNFRF